MANFRLLIYEDDSDWVPGFEFNIKPKIDSDGLELIILHKTDDSTLQQDLEWLPHLILVDHDLGHQVGSDIINQIEGDPQYVKLSIFYYSAGESIEELKKRISHLKGAVHCYIKDGIELEEAIIKKSKQ